MECNNILGKNLKRYRKVKKTSQEELADRCGMSTRTFGKIERSEVNTSLKELDKLSAGTGISAALLLSEDFEILE